MQDLHDLELIVESAVPVVVIESHEERRVVALFQRLFTRVPKPLFHWTVTEGLRRIDVDYPPQHHNREPAGLLSQIKSTTSPGIYLLSDFHPYLDEPTHVRLLKDIALAKPSVDHTVVLISHSLSIPPELERFCARFELSVPNREHVRQAVLLEAQAWSKRKRGRNVKTNKRMLDLLIENLVGLPLNDARRLARAAMEDDGAITECDLPDIQKAKFELLGKNGVLSFEYDTARFADVGGLRRLKEWLDLRRPVFTGAVDKPGLDPPKGILLLGVQGCGKSLAAKAVAGTWGVPLLRLDFGTLYNKFFGETERNLRSSLNTAQAMAPCVLWIDEIEKGVGSDRSDAGTSKRVLGSLLTWMAENRTRVFIVATANDIEVLPPELLRKGRVDEIFFADLPDEQTREAIFGIHLRARNLDCVRFDLPRLAQAAEGFSGAEIEQSVVSALYSAHARGVAPEGEHVLDAVRTTRPLSVVMHERIHSLRSWAVERTVPAN
ncbi:MAG: AAA family ATPase [Gammaproteobacteria bacterium]|nr:AAA family ATPase [Gammaproteobacteria bacterium]NIR85417.1 AAA family ATPase [Gammaproteobacteria bacterium]NIR89306.1 AAA family ATPase [Gammaproteobacteria bacterium]NIU06557.1 AAA family ATPase [Gammaproteobacteria bacterium]NIV53446.1 AAA family ATPase [Gammaproteobacteria bacterium]